MTTTTDGPICTLTVRAKDSDAVGDLLEKYGVESDDFGDGEAAGTETFWFYHVNRMHGWSVGNQSIPRLDRALSDALRSIDYDWAWAAEDHLVPGTLYHRGGRVVMVVTSEDIARREAYREVWEMLRFRVDEAELFPLKEKVYALEPPPLTDSDGKPLDLSVYHKTAQ